MLNLFRKHLLAKLATLVFIAVALGFALSTAITSKAQLETLDTIYRDSARSVAQSLETSVRHSMLMGNGLEVTRLIAKARETLKNIDIRVYAATGEEVFAPPGPPPDPADIPGYIRAVLEGEATDASASSPHSVHPIPHSAECGGCHESSTLRGVLSMEPAEGTEPDLKTLQRTLGQIAKEGFVQIMTADHEDRLNGYFAELTRSVEGLDGVTVYAADWEPYFGADDLDLSAAVLQHAVATGRPHAVHTSTEHYLITPLPNEPRCQGCHDEPGLRGALALRFATPVTDPSQTLLDGTTTTLRQVMLSGLGRLVKAFLNTVAETGLFASLTLHDHEGRLYHDAFSTPTPTPAVSEVLRQRKSMAKVHQIGTTGEKFVYTAPLQNTPDCQSCHGTDRPVRGAIEVALDTSAARVAREGLTKRSLMFATATILLALLLLAAGLRVTVLKPVQTIGLIAERVGEGKLDRQVQLTSHDEMGRLAGRMNEMIHGLQRRLELKKFVSKRTAQAVDSTDGTVELGGQRRRVTVLFSDIRGFTQFSEHREPEEVIRMLNRTLQVQSDLVVQFGGDIDKFVGDELMARFEGEGMEERAVRCAAELLRAMDALNSKTAEVTGYSIRVGVGINVGDVVLGALGSRTRKDYTVIGDTVNVAARLCSAAAPGHALLSRATREALPADFPIPLERREPLTVKGKSMPLEVFALIAPHSEVEPSGEQPPST